LGIKINFTLLQGTGNLVSLIGMPAKKNKSSFWRVAGKFFIQSCKRNALWYRHSDISSLKKLSEEAILMLLYLLLLLARGKFLCRLTAGDFFHLPRRNVAIAGSMCGFAGY
jgi:hypothetical protein